MLYLMWQEVDSAGRRIRQARSWHVGESVPIIGARVVTFQADGDELSVILGALRGTRMPADTTEDPEMSNDARTKQVTEALARLRDDDRRSREDAIELLRHALGLDNNFEEMAGAECATCPGYAVFNADPDTGYLGEIQRCDTCEKFPDDAAAAVQAQLDGFVLEYQDGKGWLVVDVPDVREAPAAGVAL